MSCMNVGINSNPSLVSNYAVTSILPSVKYDEKGVVKVALEALQADNRPQNAKELHKARINILETHLGDIIAQKDKSALIRISSVAGSLLAIGIIFPRARIFAITAGIVYSILEVGLENPEKEYWLKAEIDAEKAFADKHPEKVGDDKERAEFIYEFLFDYKPEYYFDRDAGCWRANSHIFPEAQAKHNKLAKMEPLPEYFSYRKYDYYD